jgi:hypothetical protein
MKTKKQRTRKIFHKKDFNSGDGMLTSVWGPSMWHSLHTISFNYPVQPSQKDKKRYKGFLENLQFVLPCRHCRENLKENLKCLPMTQEVLKNRDSFSRYVYDLHEHINKMLNKKSNLSYNEVRERYEHFRARCNKTKTIKKINIKKSEKGCVDPLYGTKSKCIIKIVPSDTKCDTFQMNKKCETKRRTIKKY